jgi:hypothetical protein
VQAVAWDHWHRVLHLLANLAESPKIVKSRDFESARLGRVAPFAHATLAVTLLTAAKLAVVSPTASVCWTTSKSSPVQLPRLSYNSTQTCFATSYLAISWALSSGATGSYC